MKRAIGYLFLAEEDARLREYHKAQKIKQLDRLFRRINVEDAALYIDEGPAGRCQRRRRAELLDDLEDIAVFAAGNLFELGDDFRESLDVLELLDAHHVRVILIENHIDTAGVRDQT